MNQKFFRGAKKLGRERMLSRAWHLSPQFFLGWPCFNELKTNHVTLSFLWIIMAKYWLSGLPSSIMQALFCLFLVFHSFQMRFNKTELVLLDWILFTFLFFPVNQSPCLEFWVLSWSRFLWDIISSYLPTSQRRGSEGPPSSESWGLRSAPSRRYCCFENRWQECWPSVFTRRLTQDPWLPGNANIFLYYWHVLCPVGVGEGLHLCASLP